jgi:adenosyl cobinamide kinase/adenosyl cobinamide phosphate guanylyltransferase
MAMTLLTGGARSGKSALAARLGAAWTGNVTFVATAEALDDEMRERIVRHRRARPETWTTIEEPVALAEAVGAVPPGDLVIVDCLTLWVSNLRERGCDPTEIDRRAEAAARVGAARPGPTIVITNEVGSGIVPADPSTRAYRDALGTANGLFARAARRAFLVVAGRAVPLAGDEEVFGDVFDG